MPPHLQGPYLVSDRCQPSQCSILKCDSRDLLLHRRGQIKACGAPGTRTEPHRINSDSILNMEYVQHSYNSFSRQVGDNTSGWLVAQTTDIPEHTSTAAADGHGVVQIMYGRFIYIVQHQESTATSAMNSVHPKQQNNKPHIGAHCTQCGTYSRTHCVARYAGCCALYPVRCDTIQPTSQSETHATVACALPPTGSYQCQHLCLLLLIWKDD